MESSTKADEKQENKGVGAVVRAGVYKRERAHQREGEIDKARQLTGGAVIEAPEDPVAPLARHGGRGTSRTMAI